MKWTRVIVSMSMSNRKCKKRAFKFKSVGVRDSICIFAGYNKTISSPLLAYLFLSSFLSRTHPVLLNSVIAPICFYSAFFCCYCSCSRVCTFFLEHTRVYSIYVFLHCIIFLFFRTYSIFSFCSLLISSSIWREITPNIYNTEALPLRSKKKQNCCVWTTEKSSTDIK